MKIKLTMLVVFLLGFFYAVVGGTLQNDSTDSKRKRDNDNDSQNKRIEALENENNAMKWSLRSYDRMMTNLKKKIDQIEATSNNRILALEKELAKVTIYGSPSGKPFQNNQTDRNIGKRILLPDCPCTDRVAFSASVYQSQQNLGIHQKVQFDHVINNVGNGFDPITSAFKAPVSGNYFFTAVIMSYAAEDIETEIVKNGSPLVRTYSGDSTTYNQGSQSVVVALNVGDDVYVHMTDNKGANDGNIRVYHGSYSSFSGFLISQ